MKPIFLVAALVLLTGCATDSQKLTVCDGKHRRPANPYGTVLPGAPTAQPATLSAPMRRTDETPSSGCGRSR